MPYEVMVKQAHTLVDELPHEKIEYVVQILQDFKNSVSNNTSTNIRDESFHRVPGTLKRKIWMADDFDETPDCFAEYV